LALEGPVARPMRIYLAGGVALTTPSGEVIGERSFAGRQGRRLLVRLAAVHEPVSQEDLADDLWGAAWPAHWEVALRALASKLRAVLRAAGAAESLVARDGAYELRLPSNAWMDLDAAREAIHAAEHALADGDAGDACGWALVARSIASRPVLPGEPAEGGDWLDVVRRRLEDVRLRSLATLGEIWLRRGDPAMAARDATEAIGLDPFRESMHRLLIRAHLAANERAEALHAYRSCRRLFEEELGVLPSPELTALVQPLLVSRKDH
jgi:DNA-binding SARP family transcriptional activator